MKISAIPIETECSIGYNGWVYEQVCLAECFKLQITLMANLLIYLVSTSTVNLVEF